MKLKEEDVLFFKDKISKITQEQIEKLEAQKTINWMGFSMRFEEDKDRFYTMEGIYRQIKDFQYSVGLIYYVDADKFFMDKIAVTLEKEEDDIS
jgi:hypothetical protein